MTTEASTVIGGVDTHKSPLRDELVVLTKRTLVNRCLRLRPENNDLLMLSANPDRQLMAGIKTALRNQARRWKSLDEEIKRLNRQIEALVRTTAPQLVDSTASASNSPDSSWSPPATTQTASTPRQPSPNSAASHHNQQAAADPPVVTDSAAAVTEQPTARSTSSPSSASDTTNPTTSNAAPPKD